MRNLALNTINIFFILLLISVSSLTFSCSQDYGCYNIPDYRTMQPKEKPPPAQECTFDPLYAQ